MDTLDRDFDQWLDKSPSDEDIREVLEVLKKKREETVNELEQIRDYEKDEVAALEDRLMLLRGDEKQKKTTDSSVADSPIQKAYHNIGIARSKVVQKYATTTEDGSTVLNRDVSDLLMEIVKTVYPFVSKEQHEQLKKIAGLLNVDEQEKDNILNLQRTLGYDITKVLLERFVHEVLGKEPYSTKLTSLNLWIPGKDGAGGVVVDEIRKFVDACIKLVWLMLMETPPLVFCWDISESHYRYLGSPSTHFHPNDRIINPAIAIEQKPGQMENRMKGTLQITSQ